MMKVSEKKRKIVAAAVVKGKIYFYCLERKLAGERKLVGIGTRASRIYALWLNM